MGSARFLPHVLRLGISRGDAGALNLELPEVAQLKVGIRQALVLEFRTGSESEWSEIDLHAGTDSRISVQSGGEKLELSFGSTTDGRSDVQLTGDHFGTAVDIDAGRHGEESSGRPLLRVAGGLAVRLTGEFHQLTSTSVGEATPEVSLMTRATSVDQCVGELLLGPTTSGRMHGPDTGTQTLRIRDVAVQDDMSLAGRVVDADVTRVPFEHLEHLEGVGILDPTPSSLIEFAKAPPSAIEPMAQRAELRSRAEHAAKLQEILGAKAIPGSSRVAAKWAAARLHHRSLPPGWERRLRRLHRIVGYSQRPGVALLTFALTVMTVSGLRLAKWRMDGSDIGLTEIIEALSRALLLPFSIIRFVSTPEPLFTNDLANFVAFSSLALTLLFLIVALRNYLRTPGE